MVKTKLSNNFNVKWYTNTSLPFWVQHLSAQQFCYANIVGLNTSEILDTYCVRPNFRDCMHWTSFSWGWAIETTKNANGIQIIETLVSYDGVTAVVVHREHHGKKQYKMQPHFRNSLYPVPSVIRLLPHQ